MRLELVLRSGPGQVGNGGLPRSQFGSSDKVGGMSQDLLAPPKLAAKAYGVLVACIGGVISILVIVLAALGLISVTAAVWRVLAIAGLCGLSALVYFRLVRMAGTTKPERMPYVHAAISFMGLATFYLVITVVGWGTGISGGASYMWMLPVVVGMTLAVGGWGRRVGESLHCPKCEYEFAFKDEDAPVRCPECATPWLGQLRKGRRVRSGRMIAWGVALAVLGMVVLQPVFWLGPLAKLLPTPILYAGLYMHPQSMYTTWDELASRPLGDRWIRAMAGRVMADRNRRQWNVSGSRWFDAVESVGKMPADLVDKYYREGFKAEVMLPRRVKSGVQFDTKVRVTRAVEGWNGKIGVMFGGYAIDGGVAIGREPEAVWGYALRPPVFTAHKDVFRRTLSIATPGMHRVKVVYWVIYQPSFWKIDWGADHTPVKPAKAQWFQRVEVEREIEVR
jgi:hypothetical protein